MSKRDDLIAALSHRQPDGAVPIWELEFHLWDKVSRQHLVIGQEYQQLTEREKDQAVHHNAEIFISVSERCHFAALTIPSQYWEIGPGMPAYYWMPEEGRDRQAKVLRKLAPPDLMLVANCSALLGIPMREDYVSFAYRLFDAPEEIDELAVQKLQEGIQAAKRFSDLGVAVGLSTSDLADNHSTFINPAQLERYVWPYLDRWVNELIEFGAVFDPALGWKSGILPAAHRRIWGRLLAGNRPNRRDADADRQRIGWRSTLPRWECGL